MTADQALERLRAAHAAGRLGHAFLVAGPPRTAGAHVALGAARRLCCTAAAPPCGACPACRLVESRRHPDVHWVEPQKKSRQIGIDAVRALERALGQTPLAGGWKVAVIVGADRMAAPAANAFLKTLEEPSGRTLFLLLSDSPQFVLPTLRSRCQFLSVTGDIPPDAAPWRQALLDLQVEAAAPGAAPAHRPVRRLAQADRAQRLFKAMKAAAEEVEAQKASAAGAAEEDLENDTVEARAGALYREWRAEALRALLLWQRDLLLLAAGAGAEALHYPEHIEPLKRVAAGLSCRQAYGRVEAVEELNRQLDQNLPEALALAAAFGRLGG